MTNATVTLKQGMLQGTEGKLFDGRPYYSFKGIPYALAMTAERRFKAPIFPPQRWEGIRDASKHGPVCPQYCIFNTRVVKGDEDCLFLNVYTTTLTDSKLPVMVFIHGGAFVSGSGDDSMYGPQFLIQHDVVLVTFNYRLETLGFLSLDSPEVPGNAGLKDQVAALWWIRENIQKFGGDLDNVTLFGQSAGAASVTYHMLSDMSKGLFHKAIAQSGWCIQDWTMGYDAVDRAFRVGKELEIETIDKDELLQHLRKVKPTDLTKMTLKTRTYDEKYRGLGIFFAPVIEKPNGVDHFITDHPLHLLLKERLNDVPLMIGYTAREGTFPAIDLLKKAEHFNENPSYLLPKEIADRVTKEKLSELGERVKKFYVDEKPLCEEAFEQIIDLQTDRLFVYNCRRFAHFYSNVAPTYMYRFDCDTKLNHLKVKFGMDTKGACHTDDLYYLFCNSFNSELYDKNDHLRSIIDKVTKIWTDFAKTGNPTPDNSMGFIWEPFTTTEEKYLLIKGDEIKIASRADPARMELWNEIYKETGLPSINLSS